MRTSINAGLPGSAWKTCALGAALLCALVAGIAGVVLPLRAAQDQPVLPTLRMTYTDSDGTGTATLTPRGTDAATGGTLIDITITQGGLRLTGSGFLRLVEPRRYVLAGTVTDQFAQSYFMAGTLNHDDDAVRWRGSGRHHAIQDAALADEWTMTDGPLAEPPVTALPTLLVVVEPVAGSGVQGLLTLNALLEGETRFSLSLSGLLPGAEYTALLNAGSPQQPGASVTQLATFTAGASGEAMPSGLVRFRGAEDVPLRDIADGNHFVSIVQAGQVVAQAIIPALR